MSSKSLESASEPTPSTQKSEKTSKSKKSQKSKRKRKGKKRRKNPAIHATSVIAAQFLDQHASPAPSLRLDPKAEQKLRSMVPQRSKTPKLKHGTHPISNRYDALIQTLQEDPTIANDAEKAKALEIVLDAKKNNKQLTVEEMAQVFDTCAAVRFVDRNQAEKFVNRMKEKNRLTNEQAVYVMKEVDSKLVDGKIPASYLRRLIETCGCESDSTISKSSN